MPEQHDVSLEAQLSQELARIAPCERAVKRLLADGAKATSAHIASCVTNLSNRLNVRTLSLNDLTSAAYRLARIVTVLLQGADTVHDALRLIETCVDEMFTDAAITAVYASNYSFTFVDALLHHASIMDLMSLFRRHRLPYGFGVKLAKHVLTRLRDNNMIATDGTFKQDLLPLNACIEIFPAAVRACNCYGVHLLMRHECFSATWLSEIVQSNDALSQMVSVQAVMHATGLIPITENASKVWLCVGAVAKDRLGRTPIYWRLDQASEVILQAWGVDSEQLRRRLGDSRTASPMDQDDLDEDDAVEGNSMRLFQSRTDPQHGLNYELMCSVPSYCAITELTKFVTVKVEHIELCIKNFTARVHRAKQIHNDGFDLTITQICDIKRKCEDILRHLLAHIPSLNYRAVQILDACIDQALSDQTLRALRAVSLTYTLDFLRAVTACKHVTCVDLLGVFQEKPLPREIEHELAKTVLRRLRSEGMIAADYSLKADHLPTEVCKRLFICALKTKKIYFVHLLTRHERFDASWFGGIVQNNIALIHAIRMFKVLTTEGLPLITTTSWTVWSSLNAITKDRLKDRSPAFKNFRIWKIDDATVRAWGFEPRDLERRLGGPQNDKPLTWRGWFLQNKPEDNAL